MSDYFRIILNYEEIEYGPKDADGMANSVDTDQTRFQEQSDLGHTFFQTCLSENLGSISSTTLSYYIHIFIGRLCSYY